MKFLKNVLLIWEPERSEKFSDWLWSWAIDPIVVMPVVALLFLWIALTTDPSAVGGMFTFLVVLSPVSLPIGLGILFWVIWMHYIRYEFWFSQPHVLLEVTLPPEVEKTPAAMELFLVALFQTGGEATFLKRIWEGSVRPVWSLESASNEGHIGFYIHMRKGQKDIVEARLYGQFPEAQVRVVDDYAAKVPFNLQDYDIFGVEFKKTGAGALPIMTYVNYGLNMNPDKPETLVDPITHLVEFMGQIGSGEHVWMQIVMKARKKDEWYGFYYEGLLKKKDIYQEEARKAITETFEKAIKRAVGEGAEKEKMDQMRTRGAQVLSEAERDKVNSIERNLNKNIFECGIRAIYLAKRGKFNGVNIGGVATLFGAFRQPDYSSLIPAVPGTPAMFDYPWQDFRHIRRNKTKRNIMFRYRHRAYHYVPYDQVPVFMTTEEIATLWHFPSSVVKTPALNRVPARVSEAPINLPTGA